MIPWIWILNQLEPPLTLDHWIADCLQPTAAQIVNCRLTNWSQHSISCERRELGPSSLSALACLRPSLTAVSLLSLLSPLWHKIPCIQHLWAALWRFMRPQVNSLDPSVYPQSRFVAWFVKGKPGGILTRTKCGWRSKGILFSEREHSEMKHLSYEISYSRNSRFHFVLTAHECPMFYVTVNVAGALVEISYIH